MSLVLIDTSIWIDTLRNPPVAETAARVEQLLMDQRAAWCGMIELELWTGVRDAKERKLLSKLTDIIQLLPVTESVWRLACQVAAQARSAGITAPSSDYLIYATSLHYNTQLFHSDKHFDMLAKLKL